MGHTLYTRSPGLSRPPQTGLATVGDSMMQFVQGDRQTLTPDQDAVDDQAGNQCLGSNQQDGGQARAGCFQIVPGSGRQMKRIAFGKGSILRSVCPDLGATRPTDLQR